MNPAARIAEPETPEVEGPDQAVADDAAIHRAVSATNWSTLAGWRVLEDLADDVEPESMVLYTEAQRPEGDAIVVPVDLTVLLRYHATDEAVAAEYPDTFPATITIGRDREGLRVTGIKIMLERNLS
ncbi:MAG: hypothetical protein JO290_13475 [Sphingomonadaceae bacterium]|nr:hypothetical protein [Sphingomonadaceae bacterium]